MTRYIVIAVGNVAFIAVFIVLTALAWKWRR